MSDQTFKQSMDLFHKTIAKYFPDRILELDILVAICASFFIRDISQPMALFLLGNPSSGKSTLLEIIKELEKKALQLDPKPEQKAAWLKQ